MENVVVAINAIWKRGYAFHPAAGAAAAATIFQLILLRKRLQEVLFTGGFWAIIGFFWVKFLVEKPARTTPAHDAAMNIIRFVCIIKTVNFARTSFFHRLLVSLVCLLIHPF